jgi:phage I-like protein
MTTGRTTLAIAINAAADGSLPASLALIPAGPSIRGRDGRSWTMSDPQSVIAAFNQLGQDLPIDLEHATELKGPNGDEAPAVGWIKKLAIVDGAIHATEFSLNTRGRELITSQAYRYLSPAILFEKASGEIRGLSSVGLTNKPNFELPALNREEDDMDRASIAAALAIPVTSTDAEIVTAVNRLQTAASQPDPAKFVPKADLEAALNRASTAETALNAINAAQLEQERTALVDAAVKDGKIAPASKDHYLALCRAEGGIEKVKALIGSLPVIGGGGDLDKKQVREGDASSSDAILAKARNRIETAEKAGITMSLADAVSAVTEGR